MQKDEGELLEILNRNWNLSNTQDISECDSAPERSALASPTERYAFLGC